MAQPVIDNNFSSGILIKLHRAAPYLYGSIEPYKYNHRTSEISLRVTELLDEPHFV